ncbi:MAG TPA: type IV pilus assembly protein PilM [Verrucomicrobiae bacterium]|nr:type IV pilus assembly protein PilM [Verrucomicrobiae bacterium]
MALLKSVGDYFALDIGTTAIRVVQLTRDGADNWTLQKYAHVPVDIKLSTSDSPQALQRLGEVISTAIGQSGIKTRDVVIGIPSNKSFTTVVDIPNMSEQELKGTIKYQAEQYIPMSTDEAKVDWAILGQSLHDPQKIEVLLASVANNYIESRLELIEGLGLNVVAAEPDSIAMVRSLLPPKTPDARLLIDVGDVSTDLVMTYNDSPRLVRSIPTGLQSLVKAAVQNLNVQENQAQQFILKFGLAPDRLEGQVVRAIESTLEQFTVEVNKSVKFFQTRYPDVGVGGMLLSGYGAVVPAFADYLAAKTNISASIANPWQRVKVSATDQEKLQAVAMQFGVVVGLAQRKEVG